MSDVNDHAPEFDQPYYKVLLPALDNANQPLFQVSVKGENFMNDRVTWVIVLILLRILLCRNRCKFFFKKNISVYA